ISKSSRRVHCKAWLCLAMLSQGRLLGHLGVGSLTPRDSSLPSISLERHPLFGRFPYRGATPRNSPKWRGGSGEEWFPPMVQKSLTNNCGAPLELTRFG